MTELAERSLSCGAQSTTVQAGSAGSIMRTAAAADATPPDDAVPAARIQQPGVPETLAASATRWRGNGRRREAVPSWPLIVLAAPATVAVWSGWVRLGQMTGFGLVRPFPGLRDSVRVNTAITLPIGVEAYGAYACGRGWPRVRRPASGPVSSLSGRRSDRSVQYAAATGFDRHVTLLPHVMAQFLEVGGYWTDAVAAHLCALEAWRYLGDRPGEAQAHVDLCLPRLRAGHLMTRLRMAAMRWPSSARSGMTLA